MENNYKEVIIAILSSQLLLWILQTLVKSFHVFKKKHKEGLSEEFTNAKAELDAKTEALREALDSQRTSVSVFHNGGHYFTGESIKKLSMVSESVDNSGMLEPTKNETQNVPVGPYLRNLSLLFNFDFVYERNIEEKNDILAQIQKNLGVKSCLILPIFKDRPWLWFGKYPKRIVAIVYVSWTEEVELNDKIINLASYHRDTIKFSLDHLAINK